MRVMADVSAGMQQAVLAEHGFGITLRTSVYCCVFPEDRARANAAETPFSLVLDVLRCVADDRARMKDAVLPNLRPTGQERSVHDSATGKDTHMFVDNAERTDVDRLMHFGTRVHNRCRMCGQRSRSDRDSWNRSSPELIRPCLGCPEKHVLQGVAFLVASRLARLLPQAETDLCAGIARITQGTNEQSQSTSMAYSPHRCGIPSPLCPSGGIGLILAAEQGSCNGHCSVVRSCADAVSSVHCAQRPFSRPNAYYIDGADLSSGERGRRGLAR